MIPGGLNSAVILLRVRISRKYAKRYVVISDVQDHIISTIKIVGSELINEKKPHDRDD